MQSFIYQSIIFFHLTCINAARHIQNATEPKLEEKQSVVMDQTQPSSADLTCWLTGVMLY